jgi:hypothetical protein
MCAPPPSPVAATAAPRCPRFRPPLAPPLLAPALYFPRTFGSGFRRCQVARKYLRSVEQEATKQLLTLECSRLTKGNDFAPVCVLLT